MNHLKVGGIAIVAILAISVFISLFFVDRSSGEAVKMLPAYDTRCIDSDKGLNFTEKGTTKGIYQSKFAVKADSCVNLSHLMEYYCSRNKVQSMIKNCGEMGNYGCEEGKCVAIKINNPDVKLIYGNGNSNNLNLVILPYNFSEADIKSGIIEKQLDTIFYGNKDSPLYAYKFGFFNISPFDKNKDKINVYLIKKDVISLCESYCLPSDYRTFVKTYAPFFNVTNDIIIIDKNAEMNAAYATIDGTRLITIGRTVDSSVFAHEFGHVFASLNEEYYFGGSFFDKPNGAPYEAGVAQTGFGSVNCDLHKIPEKWCKNIDEKKFIQFQNAVNLSKICYKSIKNKDNQSWYEICPLLKIDQIWNEDFASKACNNLSYLLETKQIIKEGYKMSIKPYQACNKGILDPLKDVNFGIDCKPGYGYYFGCGGGVNAFRPVPFSIMGCGDADDCDNIYGYVYPDGSIDEPLYPDAIPQFSPPAQEEIEKRFLEYS